MLNQCKTIYTTLSLHSVVFAFDVSLCFFFIYIYILDMMFVSPTCTCIAIYFDCRSTKSEKLYPSMLHRNAETEAEPYYCLPVGSVLSHWSQPTSPAPGNARTFPLSPTHSTPRHSIPKNDDGNYYFNTD